MKNFKFNKRKYSKERLMRVLLYPVISEKSLYILKKNKIIVFNVLCNSNKIEIKFAIEKLLKVKVKSISILNRIGKKKRFGNFSSHRKTIRRAFIKLKNIENINSLKDIIK